MKCRELAEKLLQNPDAEVTVSVMRGDYTDEDEVDGIIDWETFVSIQSSRRVGT